MKNNWILPICMTVFLIGLLASFYAISWVGEQYVLRAEPYDPFDPVYGEYVLLQYPDLAPPPHIKEGDVFFTLEKGQDGFAVISRIENRPFFGAIEGSHFSGQVNAPQLEQYYVEQGTGPGLERAKDLQLTVDVAPWGAIRPTNLTVRQ